MTRPYKPGVLEYQDARAKHRALLLKLNTSAEVLAKFDHETWAKLDNMGMNWALVPVCAVEVGTKLVCDDGFTCLKDHAVRTVRADKDGNLYIRCDEGHHTLDGQETTQHGIDYYTGFWFKGQEPPK